MICPYCSQELSHVIDSRQYKTVRYRKYRCDYCGKTYKTTETAEKVTREKREKREAIKNAD